MGCNCGDNEYNITVNNNGNCEPTTPIYNITLANVGVNGYSPIVRFINETVSGFNIAVDNVTGTETSPEVPKLSYVNSQITNVNNTIANLGSTYLTRNGSNASSVVTFNGITMQSNVLYGNNSLSLRNKAELDSYINLTETGVGVYADTFKYNGEDILTTSSIANKLDKDGSNANNPITINNISLRSLSGGAGRISSTGTLQIHSNSNTNIYGTSVGINVKTDSIDLGNWSDGKYLEADTIVKYGTSDSSYEIATINDIPDISTKLNSDGSNASNSFIIESDYISLGNRDNANVSINTASSESFTIYNGYSTALRSYNNIVSVHSPLDNSLQRIATVDQIPTVGDGTITITQGGVSKGTFTTNQSGNTTIDLDEGGGGSSYTAGTGIDITNDTISIDTSVVAQLSDIPDVSNFVTNSSLATTLADYATQTWVGNQGYLTNNITENITIQTGYGLLNSINKNIIKANGNAIVVGNDTNTLGLYGSATRPSYNGNNLALYSDIPTVNDSTITFTQGGVTKGTITLNQSTNQTIALDAGGSGGGAVDSVNGQTGTVVLTASDVGALPDTTVIPTKTSDLTNDSGYITGITSSDVTTALGYTPSDTTLSNVTSIDANSAVQTALDGKVSKSGDTMTGSLVNTSDFEGSKYWMKVNGVNKGTNPTSTQYAAWEMVDNKGKDGGTWQAKRISIIEYSLDNSGTARMMIGPYQNTANSSNAASLTLSITSSGDTSCTFPNTTCCDGQWVQKNVDSFADQINVANSSNTAWSKSVSSYLPNDGRNYEILVSGNVVTGNTNGNYAAINIWSDVCSSTFLCRAQTRTSGTAQAAGAVWLPVGSGRTIYVGRASGWVGNFSLQLRGYRRIGTNN